VRSKRAEEYIEVMYLLAREKGAIRVKDLADKLGVRPPSVVEFLEKLSKKGYIRYEKGEFIVLSEKGRMVAEEIYSRHIALKDFLMLLLKIPEDIAERDACYIEHGIHETTLNIIKQFMKYIRERSEEELSWLRELEEYYKKCREK
jgi:DtxR family Mn-dependent transcriptional regulator